MSREYVLGSFEEPELETLFLGALLLPEEQFSQMSAVKRKKAGAGGLSQLQIRDELSAREGRMVGDHEILPLLRKPEHKDLLQGYLHAHRESSGFKFYERTRHGDILEFSLSPDGMVECWSRTRDGQIIYGPEMATVIDISPGETIAQLQDALSRQRGSRVSLQEVLAAYPALAKAYLDREL